ncbi:MAG: gluconate 2-dehydrogenase subunit 3 family protein [Gemmatimonadota bacterium]
MGSEFTRRSFLRTSGTAFGSAWIAANWPGILSARDHARRVVESAVRPDFELLTAAQAAEVEAIAARIIPSGEDGLGAREAGVVHFIDRALTTFASDRADDFREGLADFGQKVREGHAGAPSFASLDEETQIEFLRSVEDSPFFGSVWFLTLLGMFSHPSHGGNHDKIGWKLIGFDDRHIYLPPFGHYDRGAHRR